MSTNVIEPPTVALPPTTVVGNGASAMTSTTAPINGTHDTQPTLPTFPLESGWRTVHDPVTGEYRQEPLTLRDILFPTEEDIGVVYMTQSILHHLLTELLGVLLRTHLGPRDWLILHDVLVLWGVRGVPPKSPDVAAFPGARPSLTAKSYRVGRDGPLPAFVIEVTSEETRQEDLNNKPLHYAALGIPEFLIIDILNKATEPWALIGYRLDNGPYYRRLPADADGSITFTTVGLRFVAVNRTRLEVYDSTTGQRLFTSDELKAQAEADAKRAQAEAERAQAETKRAQAEAERAQTEAKRAQAEAERAQAEATARIAAEARAAELEERLRVLERQYGIQPPPTTERS